MSILDRITRQQAEWTLAAAKATAETGPYGLDGDHEAAVRQAWEYYDEDYKESNFAASRTAAEYLSEYIARWYTMSEEEYVRHSWRMGHKGF